VVVRFTPQLLNPREIAPSTNWIGGWLRLRAGLNSTEKKYLASAGNPNLVLQLVDHTYSDRAVLASLVVLV
jgi:hypothetical protein